ncbi:flagellar biosynthetic protein FliO [Psychrobacillus sp. INOP01]|uniref:flagellar biosynthetic protein FliO n=1 Tax=Psychrobacillus sp. INOP01 TaxID=2829187 RepID=UPI001BA6DA53|nr:flagellar biosynthetic protein FliO [Psychrobacillus sp. INOP01]QUG41096.1 flagellar biosynthetic protein FliO [Psychrobacillus sp. INOP01]
MRKFSLVLSVLFLLTFGIQPDAEAESDSNESVDEYLKKQNDNVNNEKESEANINETPETTEEPVSVGVSVTAWDYIKMIFALLFVIALLYGLLRFVNSRNKTFQTNQLIHNLGGVGVGQGKSLQLMQVGNSIYLVGIGEDITLLKEITDPMEIENLTKIYEEKVDIGKSIPYISELIGRLKEKGTSKTKSEAKEPSFEETFQKRLQEIQKDRSNVLKDWKTKERDNNE